MREQTLNLLCEQPDNADKNILKNKKKVYV